MVEPSLPVDDICSLGDRAPVATKYLKTIRYLGTYLKVIAVGELTSEMLLTHIKVLVSFM
jgi:hypothetical protein